MGTLEPWKRPPKAMYLHVPFCRQKCTYCDFLSFPPAPASQIGEYVQALTQEIRAMAAYAKQTQTTKPKLGSVYVGGGTPSLLGSDGLAALLSVIDECFGLSDQAECSLEANPQGLSDSFFQRCHEAGFNRISMGLQAVQPRLLAMLGRRHQAEDFSAAASKARRAGFASIGADIMLGLPGQTLQDVRETVECLLAQGIDHVSYYGLILEEGTPLARDCRDQKRLLPSEELERAQYHFVRERLAQEGLPPYEISSSAKAGHACRHNQVYWQALPYYGLGLGAHSYVDGLRRANSSVLSEYLKDYSVTDAQNRRPAKPSEAFATASVQEKVNAQEARKEMMLLGLRLDEGVSRDAFARRFGSALDQHFGQTLKSLAAQGLIADDGDCVRLTSKGRDLANQVFMAFV